MCQPSPKRFALVGKSGAGKSTVARLLTTHCGSIRISTGEICRQIARILFGNEAKATTQRLDDALTTIDSSIFLKAALREAPRDQPICVDALRFSSDLIYARGQGLIVVRVVADDEVRFARLAARNQEFDPAKDSNHRSELELDGASVDHVIKNNTDDIHLVDAAVRLLCLGKQ